MAVAQGAGKELAKFVGPMIGLLDAQQKVLEEIRRNARALVERPYLEGRTYVRDASNAKDPHVQRKWLFDAEAKFVEAANQLTDPLTRSYAWTGSAVIKAHLRPGEKKVITDHFMNAYKCAVEAGRLTADTAPLNPQTRISGWHQHA